jgi:hypothetical protein
MEKSIFFFDFLLFLYYYIKGRLALLSDIFNEFNKKEEKTDWDCFSFSYRYLIVYSEKHNMYALYNSLCIEFVNKDLWQIFIFIRNSISGDISWEGTLNNVIRRLDAKKGNR